MVFSWSWISLPCLSRSVICLYWPSVCVLLTFFSLFNAMILFRMLSWLYFLISSLVFFLCSIFLHILFLVYLPSFPSQLVVSSLAFVLVTISCISRGLSNAYDTLVAPLWIMYVMFSLMMSMSSSSCRVSNRFLNSSRNSIFFGPVYFVSVLGNFLVITVFFSISTSSLMLLITILKSIPMLTWLTTVTSLTICDLFVRVYSISNFATLFGLFHVHLLPAFFWTTVFIISYFSHSPKASPVSFLFRAQMCLLHGMVCSCPHLSIEVSHHYRVVVWFP